MGCSSSKKSAADTVTQPQKALVVQRQEPAVGTPIKTVYTAPPPAPINNEIALKIEEIKKSMKIGLKEPELEAPSNDLAKEAVTTVSRNPLSDIQSIPAA